MRSSPDTAQPGVPVRTAARAALPAPERSGTMDASKGGNAVDQVRYLLLGPMEIVVDGEPAPLPGPAERALLAQLLLAPGRTVATTTLIDRLWSGASLPVDPVNALQIRVSKLRRALAAAGVRDVVQRQPTGYRAEVAPASVDAVDFAARVARARAAGSPAADQPTGPPAETATDQLAAYDDALSLWRGDPLTDFSAEPWAAVEVGRLTELRLGALGERARVALALGRVGEVIADLEPMVAQDPTQEALAGLLMVALYRSGRQADSLEVYHRTRTMLDEALGLEVSVSLRALHERVLRQDPSLGAPVDWASATLRGRVRRPGPSTSPASRSAATPSPPPPGRPLIGRDEQLAALGRLIAAERLVTLIGPGGAGKTALAVAVAAQSAGGFDDGVLVVRLAAVTSGAQVPLAVAEAVGAPLDGAAAETDVRQRLATYLADRQVLLVLDNCEHVVDAAAALVDDVLRAGPRVTVLATSREALAVADEVQVTVGPLDTPPDDVPASQVLDYAAPQLFVERARALVPDLPMGPPDLEAVAAITRALDGIPLALELAAARTSSLSPAEIAERLGQRFALLTSRSRTAEARQRTLRATVDWSYDLLTATEGRVFDRLAVFHGGWTLAAAEAVLCDEGLSSAELLDTIGRLVERSMLVVDRGATTRFRMLETLRQYADERLTAGGTAVALRRRHAEHFRRAAAEAEWGLRSGRQREALRELREELPNLRAALAWWGGPEGDRDAALDMAGSLGLFWHLGRHLEGREVLARLMASPEGSPAARARALQAVSLVERPRACLVHPHPRCAAAAAESLTILEELGDASRAALSQVLLAVEGVTGADPERSARLLAEAEQQFAADGDRWGRAVVGFVRTEIAFKRGDDAAVRLGRATAADFRALDDPWGLSATLYHLGTGLRQVGRLEDAARTLEEAIDVAASAGLWNTVQWALADLGGVQLDLGHPDSAADLLDRAAAASRRVGDGAGEVLAGYGRGLLAIAAGEWPRARALLDGAVTGFAALGTPVMEALALVGLARCDEASGARGLAADGYEQAVATGRALGEPTLVAAGRAGLARLAGTTGSGGDQRSLVER